MRQPTLFDALRAPPVRLPIEPDGCVIAGEPDETLRLQQARGPWEMARIELHRHTDGLWMWSTTWHTKGGGGGYKVGAKWGKFAESRDDALHYAVVEIESCVEKLDCPDAKAILTWARGLQ